MHIFFQDPLITAVFAETERGVDGDYSNEKKSCLDALCGFPPPLDYLQIELSYYAE